MTPFGLEVRVLSEPLTESELGEVSDRLEPIGELTGEEAEMRRYMLRRAAREVKKGREAQRLLAESRNRFTTLDSRVGVLLDGLTSLVDDASSWDPTDAESLGKMTRAVKELIDGLETEGG